MFQGNIVTTFKVEQLLSTYLAFRQTVTENYAAAVKKYKYIFPWSFIILQNEAYEDIHSW